MTAVKIFKQIKGYADHVAIDRAIAIELIERQGFRQPGTVDAMIEIVNRGGVPVVETDSLVFTFMRDDQTEAS